MIVADTNILSTFARIQRLELLPVVAETDALYLPPSVVKELQAGLRKGLDFLQPMVDGLIGGVGYYPVELTADEKSFADQLPTSLNAGEKESIAVCALRTIGKLTYDACKLSRRRTRSCSLRFGSGASSFRTPDS